MSFMLENWRALYCNQTAGEQALEPAVAALGEPYRTQHPFWGLSCFVDFLLIPRRTVVEVDGISHTKTGQKIKDLTRTIALLKQGYRTVRIWNEDAISDAAGALSRALRGTEDTLPDLEAKLQTLLLSQTAAPLVQPRNPRGKKPRASKAP